MQNNTFVIILSASRLPSPRRGCAVELLARLNVLESDGLGTGIHIHEVGVAAGSEGEF